MPLSLNFAFDAAPLPVDALGASAEAMLYTAPDVALLRVRQLLEVFVAHVRLNGPPIVVPDDDERLSKVISVLVPAHLRTVANKDLRAIARVCNAAVHHNTVRRRDGTSFAKDAREQLSAIHSVWAQWLGVGPCFRLPDPGTATARGLAELHAMLDRIERRVDIGRDPAALAELDRLPEPPRGIGPYDDDLLRLRRLSIRRSADNHAGLPAGPPDALVDRLLRAGDGRALEEALTYLNRTAVAHLNELACADALDVLREFVEWRQSVAMFAPQRISSVGASDRTLGALLGTQAQAMAMNAFAGRSLEQSDEALSTFRAARACFIEVEDLDRQDTYRAHALIDRARLGGALTTEERAWIERRVAAAPVGALLNMDAGAPFRVALALKAHFVLGTPYAVDRVAQALVPDLPGLLARDGRLPHPYENIAGWLLRMSGCPRQIRAALEHTATSLQDPTPSIIGWIAQIFLDDAAGAPATVAPGRLGRWSERVAGRRALDALPFNYA